MQKSQVGLSIDSTVDDMSRERGHFQNADNLESNKLERVTGSPTTGMAGFGRV